MVVLFGYKVKTEYSWQALTVCDAFSLTAAQLAMNLASISGLQGCVSYDAVGFSSVTASVTIMLVTVHLDRGMDL